MTPPAAQRSPSPAPPTAPSRTAGCRSRLSHSPGKRARKVSGPIRKQDLFYRNCITIQELLYFPLSHHFIVFPNISFIMSIKKKSCFLPFSLPQPGGHLGRAVTPCQAYREGGSGRPGRFTIVYGQDKNSVHGGGLAV